MTSTQKPEPSPLLERARAAWPGLPADADLGDLETQQSILDEVTRRIRTAPGWEMAQAVLHFDEPLSPAYGRRYKVIRVFPPIQSKRTLCLPGDEVHGWSGFDALRERTKAAALVVALEVTSHIFPYAKTWGIQEDL